MANVLVPQAGGIKFLRAEVWDPSDVAGLQLWLQADAGTYQESTFVTPADDDGEVVGGWQDQSGNGNHGLQTVAAEKPLLKTNRQNSLPMVLGDGSNDHMPVALDPSGWSAITMIAVGGVNGQLDAFANCPSCYGWVGSTRGMFLATGSGQGGGIGRPDATVYMSSLYVTGGAAIAYAISTATFGAGTFQGYWNTNPDATPVTGLGAWDSTALFDLFAVQADGPSTYQNYDLGELLVYSNVVSGANLALIWAYLNTRWSLY